MITMLDVEIRRCFARRLVRWLIVVAVVGCAIAAVISRREAGPAGTADEFRLVELWVPGGDPLLGVAAMFLLIGGVLGGASMIGAEWRAGTFATLLTWEPNRRRVAVAKIACGAVAFGHRWGCRCSTAPPSCPPRWAPARRGGGRGVARSLLGAGVRIAALTGLAASLMASIAMIGRNTAAALGVAFAYLMVVENIVHAWKPWAARFLLGPNGAVFVTGADLETEEFSRSAVTAGLTLTAYVGVGRAPRGRHLQAPRPGLGELKWAA